MSCYSSGWVLWRFPEAERCLLPSGAREASTRLSHSVTPRGFLPHVCVSEWMWRGLCCRTVLCLREAGGSCLTGTNC